MIEEMHAVFSGRVQGVGFRAIAKRFADQLQIKGYARNLPDGTVAICAQGSRKDLDLLLSQLQDTFGKMHAECTQLKYILAKKSYKDFRAC